jgi:hypothetical protein
VSSASKNLPKSVAEVPVNRSRSNASAKSTASEKSTKAVEEGAGKVPVARSRSSVSVKSSASKKSSKSVDDAVSSRSSASIKTDVASKTSTKSNDEISEGEESSDVDKTSSSILNHVKLIDLASESPHIAVSYGSAEEETTVVKNTPHKRWCKIDKAIAVVCIFCSLALVSYTVITVGGLNRSQSSQEQFLTDNDEPTFYPTYYPTYMPTSSSYAPTLGEEIATGKDRKGKKEKTVTDQDPV